MKNLDGAVVVVTGAGGSIGTELVLEILRESKPKRLVLLDLCEYNLYQVQQAVNNLFRTEYAEKQERPFLHYLLADIRHEHLMNVVFDEHAPDVVFHAAALKHVPMLESKHNSIEAIRTNILGTKTVLDVAVAHNVSQFLLISTDKAVEPVSMMGATKAYAEGYCREVGEKYDGIKVSIVRFGNVTGSSGSVVPLFQKQIAEGGPVTVTHPDIIRYFMTIGEAVHLVLKASEFSYESAHKVSTYILNMGRPIKIADLARDMIRLAGKDVPIEYIGLREGEKMYEDLVYDFESPVPTQCEKVSLILGGSNHPKGFMLKAEYIETQCSIRNLDHALVLIREVVSYEGDTIGCASL